MVFPEKQSKEDPKTGHFLGACVCDRQTKIKTLSSSFLPSFFVLSLSLSLLLIDMGTCREQEPSQIFVPGPIIVGAGPSGLAVAACLSNRGVPSVILERTDCLASLWQKRTYDRLKLHLPKHFCELPLMRFPKNFPKYPSKQQFISYVESYAARFNIKPVFNQTVEKAEFDSLSGLWKVKTQDGVYTSTWLVVATGENAEPVVPNIPGLKKFTGPVVHTSAYKSGSVFANRKVLVVGCGNSGMEVSLDLCRYNALPHMVVRNSVSKILIKLYMLSICSNRV